MRIWERENRTIARFDWRHGARLLGIILLAVSLTGCVDYHIGIHFRSQTQGAIVQHVRISDRLSAFDRDTVQTWTGSLTHRARDLGGSVRQRRDGDLEVTIPFINGDDLADKFDRFFGATETELFAPAAASGRPDNPPAVASHLSLAQRNFFLAIRNDLSLDFDLRGLSLLPRLGTVSLQSASNQSPIDLTFQLATPWGATFPDTVRSPDRRDVTGNPTWTLQPGTTQHLEARFWIPSPIGIGAVIVIAIAAIGTTLKRLLVKFWPQVHTL